MPVVWTAQALESLAKNGIPSRSEITDAAMGDRAECGMLNKRPVYNCIRAHLRRCFDRRMQPHHEKKNSLLRKLHRARAFQAGT